MKKSEIFLVNIMKKLGFVGIGLCALCCLLPIVGVAVGLGTISAYAFYLEKTGLALILLSITAFVYAYYRKSQQTKSCKESCECKPNVKP